MQDFVAGALVGVAIGLIAWPRGAGGQLPGAVADVVDRAVDEVESAARRELGRGGGEDAAALRAATLTAARRAEDDLAVALGERGGAADAPDELWPALLADAGGVWYSIIWLEEVPGAARRPAAARRSPAALLGRTAAAAARYRAAAAALREGRPPPAPRGPARRRRPGRALRRLARRRTRPGARRWCGCWCCGTGCASSRWAWCA